MGSLDVVCLTAMDADERGGGAVVLLHGWGAPGDDLVPLGRLLAGPGVRVFVPAAPLPEIGGGRAWWSLDPDARPSLAWDDHPAPDHLANPQVSAARDAVRALLAAVRDEYAPETVAVVGFSQGAMLALDVGLCAEAKVDRIAALSGALLTDSLPALHAPGPARPRVFIAHGSQDEQVPIAGGQRAREVLERYGYAVDWAPFRGGHDIPAETVEALGTFLSGICARKDF